MAHLDTPSSAAGDADSSSVTPGFVLTRGGRTLVGDAPTQVFTLADDAAAALRRTDVPVVAGAMPFDPDGPCALAVPSRWHRDAALPPGTGRPPSVTVRFDDPAVHRSRIDAALAAISDGSLQKVVLARRAEIHADGVLDPLTVLGTLVDQDPGGNGFLVALPTGAVLVGASPEVLVRRTGNRVFAAPLAGSAPRDPRDPAAGQRLLDSAKDLQEHAFVVDAIVAALAPFCRELRVPERPELSETGTMWHLRTPIEGVLEDDATTALDLARAVHPTPAVAGTPTGAAIDFIRAHEPDRGLYAGAVGWCDAAGDGEWMVSIRCAQISADGRNALAWAGGGIVAQSDPDAEVTETEAKFGTVLRALR